MKDPRRLSYLMMRAELDAPVCSGPAPPSPPAHLLPNYDEYFIGHRDRSAIGGRVRGLNLPAEAYGAFLELPAAVTTR